MNLYWIPHCFSSSRCTADKDFFCEILLLLYIATLIFCLLNCHSSDMTIMWLGPFLSTEWFCDMPTREKRLSFPVILRWCVLVGFVWSSMFQHPLQQTSSNLLKYSLPCLLMSASAEIGGLEISYKQIIFLLVLLNYGKEEVVLERAKAFQSCE